MLTTALEVAGLSLLAAAAIVWLGLAGILASAGGLCLLGAWLIERSR